MRLLKIILVAVFAVLAVFYGMNALAGGQSQADEGPELSCAGDVLRISVHDSRDALLRGVTAADAQDGDLTDRIIVSGVSKLVGDNTAKVTYVVIDSDDNMATLTRQIRYIDYQRPRFVLDTALNYTNTQGVALLDRLQAVDSIDGDITPNIRVSYTETTDDPRVYTMDVQVTNSMGDTAALTLPVVIYTEDQVRPVIDLSTYLVYLERGAEFDPESYIEGVAYGSGTLSPSSVSISGQVDADVPGTYQVTYSAEYSNAAGLAILTVVVE